MKQADVHVGRYYRVKVSGKLTTVRVDGMRLPTRWQSRRRYHGVNMATGRRVSFTAAKCREGIDWHGV